MLRRLSDLETMLKFFGRVFAFLMAAICTGLLLFALASHAGAKDGAFYTASDDQTAMPPGTLLKAESIGVPAFYRGKAWRILYVTRDYAGHPLTASGIVVASSVKLAAGRKRSIIAWAHPTVGTAITCAPSMRQDPLRSILGLNELIGAGQVVVATDYPGLGTPGPLGYLVGKGQARAVLDSVRAAAQLRGLDVGPDFAIYGYSQGAHAALFAAREAQSYLPGFTLRAVAAIAPPTDLEKLFMADSGTPEGRILTSYTLQSWAIKYGMSLRELLTENALRISQHINTICVDTLDGKIDVFEAQGKFDATMFRANPLNLPNWRRLMLDNSLSVLPAQVPLLVAQGSSDGIVSPAITAAAVRATCRSGGLVKFVYLANKTHGSSARAAFPTVTNWLLANLAGFRTGTSCR